jgi:hypothetical protein
MKENECINLMSLLKEWSDPDITQYYLACSLGILAYDSNFRNFRRSKHIFWTKNKTSALLRGILELLINDGLIEFDPEDSKYRWKATPG